jgi:protein SCO1
VRVCCAILLAAVLTSCAPRAPAAPALSLTDDGGRPWSLAAQRGRPLLLTFGFTHCADTCPETLAKLTHLRRELGEAGRNLEIAMVTVDPQRDTPAALHRFVGHFDGPVVGLTGSPAQVAAVERVYHVWAQRIPGPRRAPQDYDVVHPAIVYFIDANGAMRGIHDDGESDAAMHSAVRDLL